MPEIRPHPVGCIDAAASRSRQPDAVPGRRILRLPVQRVVVALVAIVQETPDGCQERHCLLKLLTAGAGGQRSPEALRILSCPQANQPLPDIRIPQTAGAILDIGLQVKQRVAELRMALAGELRQLYTDRFAIASAQLRDTLFVESGEHILIPADAGAGPAAPAQTRGSPRPGAHTRPAAESQRKPANRSPTTIAKRCESAPWPASPRPCPPKTSDPHRSKERAARARTRQSRKRQRLSPAWDLPRPVAPRTASPTRRLAPSVPPQPAIHRRWIQSCRESPPSALHRPHAPTRLAPDSSRCRPHSRCWIVGPSLHPLQRDLSALVVANPYGLVNL